MDGRKHRKTKIEKLGKHAEVLVHQERAQGKGYRKIAEAIEDTFGEQVSHQTVKNYLEKHGNERLAKLGAKNAEELKKKEVERILDIGDQLKKINDKLNTALESIDETEKQDMGFLVNLSKEIRQQLKFHKEFIEEVTQPDKVENNVEVNKTQQVLNISSKLEELEEKGIIEIKNPDKLEPY